MQLNLWSRSQREAVHETVRAHCSAYGLHLVALVISHSPNRQHDASPSFVDTLDAADRADSPRESHSEENAWRNSVLEEVTEPVLMACDYKSLLAEASGRVIILSNFTDGQYCGFIFTSQCFFMLYAETGTPLASMSLASRNAAAETLAELLESRGIRVSSIHFGPLAQCSEGPSSERQRTNR
jgi:hypothetical protein